MIKTLILTLIFSILACDLISEKDGHAILLNLEKELMNYNYKIKQEQISLEKEKKAFVESNPNSSNLSPVLSKEAQAYLEQQISKSKELEQKCNKIIQTSSTKIKEMDELYNQTLQLEKKANEIKTMSYKERLNGSSKWSTNKKIKVDNLSQQAQKNISPAKKWTEDSKRIHQSLKDSIETAINNIINYTYYLGEEIKMGKIPEIWISRISEHNQSANKIIKEYEETLKESAKQSDETANNFVKELEKDVKEALNIINSNSY